MAALGQNENRHQFQSLRLSWPRRLCPLLLQDVVLVDTPEIETDEGGNFDLCSDADVFVWVTNGEATIARREKLFFERVADKTAKPNILVLVNRWDYCADYDDRLIQSARSQHLQRTSEFLVSRLKVATTMKEAEKRIFFVSAKEMMLGGRADTNGSVRSKPGEEMRRRDDWERQV